jgi:heptosyltransferase-2
MRILAIKLRQIGDTVIWTSALAALREQFPSAEITVMTYATNAPVLVNSSDVNKFYFLKTKSRWELIQALWRARWWKYDWLLGFHATTSLCRWAWLAGARRLALHHHSWAWTPRGSVEVPEPGKLEDAISRDYQIVRAVIRAEGVSGQPKRMPTRIVVSTVEAMRAEEQVVRAIEAVGGDPKKKRFVFLPGAAQHLRRYPRDLWLKLVEDVARKGEFQLLVMVDASLSAEWGLREECARLRVPLFDSGTLRDFIVLMSRAERAFANDSGPGHMAVALGLKTTFVFGPGCVGDWHPYDDAEHPVLRVAVECRLEGPRDQERFQFCVVKECAHHKCMRGIQIQFE